MVKKTILLIAFLVYSLSGISQSKKLSTPKLIAESNKSTPLSHVVSLDLWFGKEDNMDIYIADVFTSAILMMKKQGDRLKMSGKLGRRGKGPGEFLSVDNLQIFNRQKLMVYDREIGRISIFDLKTETLSRTLNISVGEGKHLPKKFYVLNNKEQSYYASSKRLFQASDDFDEQRNVLLQEFKIDGSLFKDSLLVKPASDALIVQKGGDMAVNPQPVFGNKSIFRFTDGLIYYGYTGNSTIEIYNTAAKLLRKIKLDINSLEVTDNDIELALEKESLMLQEDKQFIRKDFLHQVPEYWSYYQNYIIDSKGRLWIGLSNHLNEDQRIWEVFDSKGNLVKKVKLPSNFTVFQVQKGYIIGEYLDKKFQSFVQLYQM